MQLQGFKCIKHRGGIEAATRCIWKQKCIKKLHLKCSQNSQKNSTFDEKFCLQKDKCAYFINYGIAPHFCSILMNNVKDSKF